MKFLRLRDSDNHGPYQLNYSAALMAESWSSNNESAHPHPCHDDLLNTMAKRKYAQCPYIWDRFFYGFSSIEQFRRWFFNNDALAKLAEFGFSLYVYEADENQVIVGHTQTVIEKDYYLTLTPLRVIDLASIPEAL